MAMNIMSWRPTPLIALSILLHGLSLPLLWLWPGHWRLIIGVVLLDHLLVVGLGLWPRSSLIGSNWTRLPGMDAVALTIDDGPDPLVTPAVLDLLEQYGACASFFCIGERAERYPDLVREIVRRGHAVENHSQHHRLDFSLLGPRAMAREVDRAQSVLHDLSGQAPAFFRAPAGLRNIWLAPLLARRGLQLASWSRRGYDTREPSAERVTERLLQGLRGGDVVLLHDGNAARTSSGEPVILAVLAQLLPALHQAGLPTVTLRAARTPSQGQ
jgi:peptidoglycan/xylan/chitin deacetylase (PgdA/CDA1 family)